MAEADRVPNTPPLRASEFPTTANRLTQPSDRFDSLAEAEDTLKHQGFKLVPDTCDWINEARLLDAGTTQSSRSPTVSASIASNTEH